MCVLQMTKRLEEVEKRRQEAVLAADLAIEAREQAVRSFCFRVFCIYPFYLVCYGQLRLFTTTDLLCVV